jgi:hypothetical protein
MGRHLRLKMLAQRTGMEFLTKMQNNRRNMMEFRKSSLQVNDLNEVETLGLLDAAIENASARREVSMEILQTEADEVHGGFVRATTPIPVLTGFVYRPEPSDLGSSTV